MVAGEVSALAEKTAADETLTKETGKSSSTWKKRFSLFCIEPTKPLNIYNYKSSVMASINSSGLEDFL